MTHAGSFVFKFVSDLHYQIFLLNDRKKYKRRCFLYKQKKSFQKKTFKVPSYASLKLLQTGYQVRYRTTCVVGKQKLFFDINLNVVTLKDLRSWQSSICWRTKTTLHFVFVKANSSQPQNAIPTKLFSHTMPYQSSDEFKIVLFC